MENKYMTLKEVLFGETLNEAYIEVVNNPPMGTLEFCVPGMIHHQCIVSDGPDDKLTLIVKRGLRNKYEFTLSPTDIETPEAWKSALEANSKLAELIDRIPEEEENSLETISYDDMYILEGILRREKGTWPRVMAAYQMAYGLANYMIELIASKKMQYAPNQRRTVWLSPSAIIRTKTVVEENIMETFEYPQIKIIRYTNTVKHEFEMHLAGKKAIPDKINTWVPELRKMILFILLGECDDAVTKEFCECIASVVCKAPKEYRFHTNKDKLFVEEELGKSMTEQRMFAYFKAKIKVPAWIVIPEDSASKMNIPYIDMIGDIGNGKRSSFTIAPCTTRHIPVYNKPEKCTTKATTGTSL